MNKSKRRVSNRIQDEDECEESTESLLLEENVNKLLDINVEGPRKRNIFTDAQEPHQRIRRSIVKRALQNVISSTPMPTKANGKFFSTECSLDISPINSENDEQSIKGENKNTISAEPNQPQNVDPNVISVSSDSSDTKCESSDNAKSKHLVPNLDTYYTRSQRKKLGEKISPNTTKSDKELIHSIGDKCKSREVNVNGINQTHIRLPEHSVTPNDTELNANDKVDTNLSKIYPCVDVTAGTSERIALESDEKVHKTIRVSKSPCRTKSVDRTSNNRVTKNASKSPYRTSNNRITQNASKSPYRFKAVDKITDNSELKSAEKCQKISKNVSVNTNRINTTEKSNQTNGVNSESIFHDKDSSNINSNPEQSSKSRKNQPGGSNFNVPDIHRYSYSLRNSVNSVCLSPVQESQDFETPTRPDECVRTASVSLMISSKNVTLRKRSQIDNREQFIVEGQNTAGNAGEEGNKRLKNFEEKSSKIPVLRTRSKSREKPNQLESQARNRSPGENIQSNNSNKENKDALLSSPPKPAPRGRKKKKPALVKSSEKNHSIQKIVEGVDSSPNVHASYSSLPRFKTTEMFQKRFVDTGTSPNISPRPICDPAETRSTAIGTKEQVAESSVFLEEKKSLTLGSFKRTTFSVPKRVVDTAVSPSLFFSSSSSTEKEERCRRLDNIIAKMTEQQSPLNNSISQLPEESFKPRSNPDTEKVFLAIHKQVQTSSRKSGKTNRKAKSNKKHCARNIFTKTVAETQTSINNNDDSSGMTDSSKFLEEFDSANLFKSLEKGPVFYESFWSPSNNFDDSEVMRREAPWRYEDQVVSQSSKRVSAKLNFLRSANQVEEEKLSKRRLEPEFDTSEDSGGIIDYIDKNREKQLPRLKSTFRDYTHKSTKKKAVEDSRKNIDSSTELDSDHSVFDRDIEGVSNHPKRMSLEKEPHEENTEKDVEPEENTLIAIDSSLQRSKIQVEKGNSEENLITPQRNKLVTPRTRSKKENSMILKRKSVETQKNHELPSKCLTETKSPHSQKSITDPCLENQLENGLSDSENEKDQEKGQNKYESSKLGINHSRNISKMVNDIENFSEMIQSNEIASTHSFIGNKTRIQEHGSETAGNQIQKETPTKKRKDSKTSLSAKTSNESRNQNNFKIDTRGENNEETDSREREAERRLPTQFDLNTDNCRIESLEVLQADDKLENDTTAKDLSYIENQRKLSIMLKKLSVNNIHRKWNRINKILDSEDEDDSEVHHNKNTPNNRNQFEGFNDLSVPLNQNSIRTTPKSPRTVNGVNDDVVLNAKEESQKKSAKNPESGNKKEEEPVFKVPKTTSRKITRKRPFPSSGDDISVSNEDSSETGTRRSGRDRKPPKRRFVMELFTNPASAPKKSRTKPVKTNPVESTNKRDARKKDQQKTQTTVKRGKPKKITPLPEYISDKDKDNLTEVPQTMNKRHTTRKAALGLTEDEDNSTEEPASTSKWPKKNKKSTLNTPKNNDKSTNQPKTASNNSTEPETVPSKRSRSKKKTLLNSLENEDNSIHGPKTTSKIASIDEETTSVPTEKKQDQIHSITAVNNDNEIDTPSHIQDDPNHFEIGEESQDLDYEICLRLPNPQNMISQDSGTSTLKNNTFDVSNLQSIKQPRKVKVNKPNKKISKVVSETVSVSPRNEVNTPEEKDKMTRRSCVVENEFVNISSGSEIVRLKYVENDVVFQKCRDDMSLTKFISDKNGTTLGYLKLPSNGMKPVHTAKKHSLCYFVLEGEGEIQVHNRKSKVRKLSHFIIPSGLEYAIMNDGPDDMLLAYVRVEGT